MKCGRLAGAWDWRTHWRLAKQALSRYRRIRSRDLGASGTYQRGGWRIRGCGGERTAARARYPGPARARLAIRRKSAPAGGALLRAQARHRGGGTASRQGALLQQPGGSRCRLGAGPANSSRPAAAIIKHTNPCGCAEQATLAEAIGRRSNAIPVSAYGGVLAFNRAVDEETAREIAKTFVEAIAAPDYAPEALAILTAKKNLRLLKVATGAGRAGDEIDQRRIPGADGGRAPPRPDAVPGENEPRSHGSGMARAAVRVEGDEAREIERDRLRAGRADRGGGRGADEPRGFGEDWQR